MHYSKEFAECLFIWKIDLFFRFAAMQSEMARLSEMGQIALLLAI